MVSPAGDMEVNLSKVSRKGNQLVIIGQMGVWDSEIYFTPEEAMSLALSMLNLSLLPYFFSLPFMIIYRKLFQRESG
jgi:hypothetical protein